ncbi:unnamed protein product, partial [Rotaria socialis]
MLLGNDDGTFQDQIVQAVGTQPSGLTSGDFNNDSILDAAVTNQGDNTINVLISNGNGTFQVVGTYQIGNGPDS